MVLRAFVAVILAGLLSDGIKFLRDRNRKLFESGGMPSTHAVLASSVVTAVYLEDGFSLLFFISAVVGFAFVWDAQGYRREIGRHSQALNKLVKGARFKNVGHTPVEVLAGVALGIVVTLIVYLV